MKYYSPDSTGGGDKQGAPSAPQGYVPLSVQNRQDWNDFLDFLGKKGVGGSTDLDKRDQKLGLSYLSQYRKLNPKTTVTADIIPSVQYEQYMLRKGDSFPGLAPEELKYMRNGLNAAYLSRPVSDIDGWLGSLTSKSYYPTGIRMGSHGEKYNFGVDFSSYVKSLNDPELQKKYLVQNPQ